MGGQRGVAARGTCRRFHPLWRKGRDEHVRLRLPCPCTIHPRFGLLAPCGKHCCFPFSRRGANGGITMSDLNRVQHIGHLGHDPQVTYTEQGTARTTFSVATSAHWKDADGRVQEGTKWTPCV